MSGLNFRFLFVLLLAILLFSLPGYTQEAPGDIRFERDAEAGSSSFPPALFQHWKHRINYRCDACHDSLFPMKQGGTVVKMAEITAGQSCGTCHNGQVAFDSGVANCGRCHAVVSE
jgi:c(7)-type cytochrome triheme protein